MLLMLLMLMLMLMMLLMLLTIMAGEVVWSGRSMFLPGVFSWHCSQSARLGACQDICILVPTMNYMYMYSLPVPPPPPPPPTPPFLLPPQSIEPPHPPPSLLPRYCDNNKTPTYPPCKPDAEQAERNKAALHVLCMQRALL